MNICRLLTACASAALAAPVGVSAHHAFSANYDVDNVGTVQGVVEEVYWANPHVHYYVRVAGADGTQELWDVETMNLSTMIRRGWSKSTVSVGDEITITGAQGRRGAHRIWMGEVTRVDGAPLPESP